MDEQFRNGFDRILSDVPDGPSWQDVGGDVPQPTGKRLRGRGPLVAVAAFLVTIVAVGGGLFALTGRSGRTAPAATTVDHIELSWAQDVVLRCVGMEKTDNEGFGVAMIDIWGPNADGLLRIDATAPDGTVERIVATYPRDRSTRQQVWSSQGPRTDDTVFRVAKCSTGTENGSSHYWMSGPPISSTGHVFGRFIAIPIERRDGEPWNLENDPFIGDYSSDEEWNGISVKVFMRTDTGVDDLGPYGNRSETWVDVTNRRYEVQRILADHDVLGTVATAIEVTARDTVPADSVSFSTENMNLTLDIPPTDPSNETESVTTTSTAASDFVDPEAFEDLRSLQDEINRQRALLEAAKQELGAAEEAIQRNEALLTALEAQDDPPAKQAEMDRQRAVLRISELRKEYLEETIRRTEAYIERLVTERNARLTAAQEAAIADTSESALRYTVDSATVDPVTVTMGDLVTVRGRVSLPFPADRLGLTVWLVKDRTFDLLDRVCRTTPHTNGDFDCSFRLQEGGLYGAVSPGDFVLAIGGPWAVVPETAFTIEDS